jgi:hypothetical protein
MLSANYGTVNYSITTLALSRARYGRAGTERNVYVCPPGNC